MTGTLALARLEVKRLLLRSRGYLILTVALPVALYLVIGRLHGTANGVANPAYYMIAMAAWGAFTGALTGNAVRIAQERKDGWTRQLRLTALPARSYVAAKVTASTVTVLPAIVIVLALGRLYGGVRLAGWQWPVIGAVILLMAIAFAALAVAIGYRFMPDQAQPITMIIYFAMTLLGGLLFPLSGFIATIGKVLPTYQVARLGSDVISSGTVPVSAIAVILGWLAAFTALAVLAVRATAETR
jgi:ABC-2 type transport system permease protein